MSRWTSDGSNIKSTGGFSLVCGKVDEPLAIFSNREHKPTNNNISFTEDEEGIRWVSTRRDQTVALSNTWLGDRSWAKVVMGENLMEEAISAHVASGEDEERLIQHLLDVLSVDTLPRLDDDAGFDDYIAHFQESIFVPVIGSMKQNAKTQSFLQGLYGTQKQTVLLVRFDGTVRYFERTLYENDNRATQLATRDQSYEFEIEK